MAEIQNANGLTLLEGLSGMEGWQRSESAICNAELLKWAQDEIKRLRTEREALVEMIGQLTGALTMESYQLEDEAKELIASLEP